jgi:hypothetical protein
VKIVRKGKRKGERFEEEDRTERQKKKIEEKDRRER